MVLSILTSEQKKKNKCYYKVDKKLFFKTDSIVNYLCNLEEFQLSTL